MTKILYEELTKLIEETIADKELRVDEFNQLINEIWVKHKADFPNCDDDCRFFNKFFCEILPLEILAERLSSKVIKVYSHGHQFDALLDNKHNIEVTCVIDGYYRRQILNTISSEGGHVSGSPREQNYTKLKDHFKLTLKNKYDKSNLNDKDGYLLIGFFISHNDTVLESDELIKIINSLPINPCKFSKHYFIGWHKDKDKQFFYYKT